MTSFAEEVTVTRVGELNSHARTIIICLHHEVEVVSLCSTGCELGVDVELTLPLTAADSTWNSDLVGVAIVGGLIIRNLTPAVVGKPVAEGVKQCSVVNTLPEVGT